MDELVQSVNKFAKEFDSLRQMSTEIFKEREAAEGMVEEATATLAKTHTEWQKARDKFEEAQANRLQAAVDIGMSLRFLSVGEQSLSEPSSDVITLTPKQLTVVKALKKSPYYVVDEFLKEGSEINSVHAAVRE